MAAASCLVAGSAAADVPRRGPEAVPAWTGLYLGVGGGAGAVVHDLALDAGGTPIVGFQGLGGAGFFGSVIFGYDRQLTASVVAGVFVDYDLSNIGTDIRVPIGGFNTSIHHKHAWSIGGRLGLLSSPTTLWYGTAGYTRAAFDDVTLGALGTLNLSDFGGYFVGGGIESKLRDAWSVRFEYRFSQFEHQASDIPGVVHVDLEPAMHTARVELQNWWA